MERIVQILEPLRETIFPETPDAQIRDFHEFLVSKVIEYSESPYVPQKDDVLEI